MSVVQHVGPGGGLISKRSFVVGHARIVVAIVAIVVARKPLGNVDIWTIRVHVLLEAERPDLEKEVLIE